MRGDTMGGQLAFFSANLFGGQWADNWLSYIVIPFYVKSRK